MRGKLFGGLVICLILIISTIVLAVSGNGNNSSVSKEIKISADTIKELKEKGIYIPVEFEEYDESSDFKNKTRLKKNNNIISMEASKIWDIEIQSVSLIKGIGNNDDKYFISFEVSLANKTNAILEDLTVELLLNPELEAFYPMFQTHIVEGPHKVHPVEKDGDLLGGFILMPILHLSEYNIKFDPTKVSLEELRNKFDIYFREMYILTKWAEGEEVVKVNPANFKFTNVGEY